MIGPSDNLIADLPDDFPRPYEFVQDKAFLEDASGDHGKL